MNFMHVCSSKYLILNVHIVTKARPSSKEVYCNTDYSIRLWQTKRKTRSSSHIFFNTISHYYCHVFNIKDNSWMIILLYCQSVTPSIVICPYVKDIVSVYQFNELYLHVNMTPRPMKWLRIDMTSPIGKTYDKQCTSLPICPCKSETSLRLNFLERNYAVKQSSFFPCGICRIVVSANLKWSLELRRGYILDKISQSELDYVQSKTDQNAWGNDGYFVKLITWAIKTTNTLILNFHPHKMNWLPLRKPGCPSAKSPLCRTV